MKNISTLCKFAGVFIIGIGIGRTVQNRIIASKFEDVIIELATVKETSEVDNNSKEKK